MNNNTFKLPVFFSILSLAGIPTISAYAAGEDTFIWVQPKKVQLHISQAFPEAQEFKLIVQLRQSREQDLRAPHDGQLRWLKAAGEPVKKGDPIAVTFSEIVQNEAFTLAEQIKTIQGKIDELSESERTARQFFHEIKALELDLKDKAGQLFAVTSRMKLRTVFAPSDGQIMSVAAYQHDATEKDAVIGKFSGRSEGQYKAYVKPEHLGLFNSAMRLHKKDGSIVQLQSKRVIPGAEGQPVEVSFSSKAVLKEGEALTLIDTTNQKPMSTVAASTLSAQPCNPCKVFVVNSTGQVRAQEVRVLAMQADQALVSGLPVDTKVAQTLEEPLIDGDQVITN